jgi:asparagine synthase (glutamine-hydrolysing)
MPLTTISVIFDEIEFNERDFARLVAEQCKSDHREITFSRKDFYNGMDAMLQAMDQPTIDGVNVYAVSGAARKAGVKVVLSGAGGDEVFLGYRFFQSIDSVEKFQAASAWLGPRLRNLLISLGLFVGRSLGKQSIAKLEYLRGTSAEDAYLLFRGLFSPQEIQDLLGLNENELANSNQVQKAISLPSGGDLLNKISLMDFKHYLGNQLLKDCDFMSMAHSLETRLPFLDHVLVEEVLKVPAHIRVGNGSVPKPLLLAALGHDLPRQVWDRPKMGFLMPFELWIRAGSKELEARCQDHGVLNRQAVARVWNRFRSGEIHWSRPWALVVLSHWLARKAAVDNISK